jgi:DNA repair exonuclease SbcCD ATPase subunit
MKLCTLEIAGFRGFAQRVRFDLDASAVLLIGANGQGKTSFFDAILWAITGRIPRLGGKDEHLVSMFSESGEARVSLTLQGGEGDSFTIKRLYDGEEQQVLVEEVGKTQRGAAASNRIIERLWPASAATQSPIDALTDALTRSVYLQQDLVREFVESDDEQRRFAVVSELCGAGRVTELQSQLERSRNAWTRSTTTLRSEADEISEQVGVAEARMGRLEEAGETDRALPSEWDEWWTNLGGAGISIGERPGAGASEAASALNEAVREVRVRRQRSEQMIDRARLLRQEIEDHASRGRPDLLAMREELQSLQEAAEGTRRRLEAARERAAEERRRQVEQGERNQELAALAQIARRHLNGRCPVCDQEFDRDVVESHLAGHISRAESLLSEGVPAAEEVERLAGELEERERALASRQRRHQEAEAVQRDLELWEAQRDRRVAELGIDAQATTDVAEAVSYALVGEEGRCAALRQLEEKGESLSLRIARASEIARRGEIEQQLANLRSRLNERARQIRARQETGDLATRIIDQLREVSLEVVGTQMEQMAPLLQRIYSTADPHPAFRSVRLMSKIFRGKGRLATEIGDLVDNKTSRTPELVLSSSQMNALAVSIFLSLNLGVPSLPVSTAMLDDPLQSLDDVNLLGLIDLLRRLTFKRQLVVSTHDSRFGKLLQRKLRPVAEDQRTHVIELEAWSRSGPQCRSYDVTPDRSGLRIVAA